MSAGSQPNRSFLFDGIKVYVFVMRDFERDFTSYERRDIFRQPDFAKSAFAEFFAELIRADAIIGSWHVRLLREMETMNCGGYGKALSPTRKGFCSVFGETHYGIKLRQFT